MTNAIEIGQIFTQNKSATGATATVVGMTEKSVKFTLSFDDRASVYVRKISVFLNEYTPVETVALTPLQRLRAKAGKTIDTAEYLAGK